jgi:hypothetical protein
MATDAMTTLSIFTKPSAADVRPSSAGQRGCDLLILVAQRGGALRKIFDDRVRGYEILSGRRTATIRFVLHGSYCGGHGNSIMRKNAAHHVRAFKFEQPN